MFFVKKYLFLLLFPIVFQVQAQYYEFGLFGGGANYFGDLNAVTQFRPGFPALGGFFRYNMNPYMAHRFSAFYGKVSFEDRFSNVDLYQMRNLSFRTNISELSYQFEFNFFRHNKEDAGHSFTPYIFAGAGVFHFNPKTEYRGELVELQPVGTEGQNSLEDEKAKYSLLQIAFPVGGGLKYSFNKNWSLNLEVGNRLTTTDYLDDVSKIYPDDVILKRYNEEQSQIAIALSDRSAEKGEAIGRERKQRGHSEKKDHYMFFGIGITYTINNIVCPTFDKSFTRYE